MVKKQQQGIHPFNKAKNRTVINSTIALQLTLTCRSLIGLSLASCAKLETPC